MRIEIDIPDWLSAENLYLITRSSVIAKKIVGSDWVVKYIHCSKCGRCCEKHPVHGAYFPLKEDGSCVYLVKDGVNQTCSLGMEKPLACVIGEPEGTEHSKFNCCIEYK